MSGIEPTNPLLAQHTVTPSGSKDSSTLTKIGLVALTALIYVAASLTLSHILSHEQVFSSHELYHILPASIPATLLLTGGIIYYWRLGKQKTKQSNFQKLQSCVTEDMSQNRFETTTLEAPELALNTLMHIDSSFIQNKEEIRQNLEHLDPKLQHMYNTCLSQTEHDKLIRSSLEPKIERVFGKDWQLGAQNEESEIRLSLRQNTCQMISHWQISQGDNSKKAIPFTLTETIHITGKKDEWEMDPQTTYSVTETISVEYNNQAFTLSYSSPQEEAADGYDSYFS